MPSISQLNVRLGLIYRDLDKGLEQVEKRMRASGRRLSDLGDNLTVAISLPMAAAGAAAVKSAADIESLQLALESQVGSAEAARKELELLRQEALKPGLGFEQAVRGSVTLQAVGFSADKARKIIAEFGNGLAIAGKGAQELDGVILALSQIQSKGVVSAEEINQIAERLPQIRTLMQAAFGTASSEAIQKLGISSQQFIEGITNELQKLPRAAGGIRNSLDNFFDGIKQGAAKFGFAISEALDVPGKLESLTAGLGALADGFANLNPEVQQFIIYAGAAVVAAGPLAKVFGAIQLAGAQFIGVLQGGLGVIKGGVATVLGLTDAVNRLKLAFGIVGVVAAVGAAVFVLAQRFDAATYAQEQFTKAQRDVATETAKEIGALERNFEVLKNVNSTTGERKAAVDALMAQYPSYLKGINLEIQSVDKLTQIQKGLVDQIQRGVAERKKAEALNAIYEKRAAILFRVQQLREGADATVGESTLIDTGDTGIAGAFSKAARNEAIIKKLLQQSEDLRTSADATGKTFDQAFGLVGAAARRASPASQVLSEIKPVADAAAASAGNLSDAQKKQQESAKKLSDTYKEVLSDIANLSAKQDLLGARDVVEQAEAIENGIKRLLDAGFKPASVQVQQLKKDLQGLFAGVKGPELPDVPVLPTLQTPEAVQQTDSMSGFTQGVKNATVAVETYLPIGTQLIELQNQLALGTISSTAAWDEMVKKIVASSGTMAGAAAAAAGAFVSAAASGEASFQKLGQAALQGAAQVIRAKILESIAFVTASAFAKFGLFGFIGAAVAGGAVLGLFNKLVSAVSIPNFATGTNFHKGGLAITGEKGPELLSLPRGTQVTPNSHLDGMLGNSGGGNFIVSHKIQGSDLLFIIERTQRNQSRVRGF